MSKSTCSVPSCERPSRSRGMCDTHYRAWVKFGTPTPEFNLMCVTCRMFFTSNTLARKKCSECRARPVESLPRERRMQCAGCGKWIARSRTSRPEGQARCRDCRGSRDKHGTATCYHAGCRCDECKAAASERMREYRERYRAKHGVGPASAWRQRFKEANGYWPQARYGYDIPHRTRRAVYERDGWVCQICQRPIPRDYDSQDRLAPALDHIVPRSAQLVPDHSEENLRMVHHVCNSYRSNTDRSDTLVAALTAQFFTCEGASNGDSSCDRVHGVEEVPAGGLAGSAG